MNHKPDPYRCPVCGGNGLVSNGFYMTTTGIFYASNTDAETCRACNGTGIVWATPSIVPQSQTSKIDIDFPYTNQ